MKSLLLFFLPYLLLAQRGTTGDATFAKLFPADVHQESSNASLLVTNNTDHDIIALIRGQRNEYLRHAYIRTQEKWLFIELPITRFYVQFRARAFYFEDLERTVVNFGEKHLFEFFYDPQQHTNYKQITKEEFFRH